jgi:hypothetical protein
MWKNSGLAFMREALATFAPLLLILFLVLFELLVRFEFHFLLLLRQLKVVNLVVIFETEARVTVRFQGSLAFQCRPIWRL